MAELTAAQRRALEVLAYAESHGRAAETGRRSEIQFPTTLPPGRPRISARAAASLIDAGLATPVTGLPGDRRVRLTDAGRQLCARLDLTAEVAA